MNKEHCPNCGRFAGLYVENTPSGDFEQLYCKSCGWWQNI